MKLPTWELREFEHVACSIFVTIEISSIDVNETKPDATRRVQPGSFLQEPTADCRPGTAVTNCFIDAVEPEGPHHIMTSVEDWTASRAKTRERDWFDGDLNQSVQACPGH